MSWPSQTASQIAVAKVAAVGVGSVTKPKAIIRRFLSPAAIYEETLIATIWLANQAFFVRNYEYLSKPPATLRSTRPL